MTSRMINTLCQCIFIFYNVQRVSSASIDISNFQCDEGYPMDVLAYKFSCNGGSQCSFGDYASFEGEFQYENLTSNIAYMSANLSIANKFSQPMFDYQEIDLCGNFTSDWGGACPDEDGIYDVSISFQMPSSNGEIMDWFLTGFKVKSIISIYSDQYMTDVLANCHATLVTNTQGYLASQYLNDTIHNPTAFHAMISLWVLLGLAAFICCYKKTKNRKTGDSNDDSKKEPLIEMAERQRQTDKSQYDDIENARSHDANSVYDDPRLGASESSTKEGDDDVQQPQIPNNDKNFT